MAVTNREKIALARRAKRPAVPPTRQALTDAVRAFAFDLGADIVGIASAGRFEGAPPGHHPRDWLPGCRSVVVFAIRQLEAAHDWPWMMQGTPIATDENRLAILQEYWIIVENHDVHDMLLDQMALRLALYLQRLGHPSIFHESGFARPLRDVLFSKMRVDTPHGLFSNRHAAVRAGLGEFGLNNLVITPEYGPYVRFVSVLTEADLVPDELLQEKACLGVKCSLCLEICGGKVLTFRPGVSMHEVWLDPPTATDRLACREHRQTQYCNAQCVARCPVGLPMRATRKRLAGDEDDGQALPPVLRQVKWPAIQVRRSAADDQNGSPQGD